MPSAANLAELRRLRADVAEAGGASSGPSWPQYERDPAGYCRDVLKVALTPDQESVLLALLEPPYSVLVSSGHSVGKTFLGACIINWWYDTRDPSAAISTAPTERDVEDLLWTEVRLQRERAGLPTHFIGDAAPHMRTGPNHYAKGFTARDGVSFQGRHRPRQAFLFDEGEGVKQPFYDTLDTMFRPDGGDIRVVIYNPTQSESPTVHAERRRGIDGEPTWTLKRISALDHPNVRAGLRGEPIPIPDAVSLAQVNDWVANWCDRIDPADANPPDDIEWPPASGHWWRPGPIADARILGRRPRSAVNSVWSSALWDAVCAARHEIAETWPVQVGCDVALFGDDYSAMHVRRGMCSVHHEAHNGWEPDQVAGRLKQLAHQFAPAGADPRAVPCLVDNGGPGALVVAKADGYNFVPLNSGADAANAELYENVRTELWFAVRDLAKAGLIDVSRLPASQREVIGQELRSPLYQAHPSGRWMVERKEVTKKRLKHSPDHADAFNLAYYPYAG